MKDNIKTEKRINKKLIYAVAIILIALIYAVGSASGLWGEDPGVTLGGDADTDGFAVHYIDVGQGDCSLVVCNGKTLLIDGGENEHETKVINYLRSLKIEKLDYIIATHPHTDHIGGLPEVLLEFGADKIIMPRISKELTPTNSTYTALLKAIKASGAKAIPARVGQTYELGGAVFEILAPISYDADNLNNFSVVTRLTYGGKSFLFTGDAETKEEAEIIAGGAQLKSNVIKVGHHGSKTSSSKKFLEAVMPEICIIMCGEDNDYGHPHESVLKRIANYTDRIYRTDICGDIVIRSDGTELSVEYENQ